MTARLSEEACERLREVAIPTANMLHVKEPSMADRVRYVIEAGLDALGVEHSKERVARVFDVMMDGDPTMDDTALESLCHDEFGEWWEGKEAAVLLRFVYGLGYSNAAVDFQELMGHDAALADREAK